MLPGCKRARISAATAKWRVTGGPPNGNESDCGMAVQKRARGLIISHESGTSNLLLGVSRSGRLVVPLHERLDLGPQFRISGLTSTFTSSVRVSAEGGGL